MSNFLSKLFGNKKQTSADDNNSIVTSVEKNNFNSIKIGNQEWMSENLNVEHYRNGDIIPQVQDKYKWTNLSTGAWCYYNNDTGNNKTYGKLYNWNAVNDPRGLAPEGWHIPSDEEWTELIDFLGGVDKAGNKLKAIAFRNRKYKGATNESGFSALLVGYRLDYGDFFSVGNLCEFWTASEEDNDNARFINLNSSDAYVGRSYSCKDNGLSVRCVKGEKIQSNFSDKDNPKNFENLKTESINSANDILTNTSNDLERLRDEVNVLLSNIQTAKSFNDQGIEKVNSKNYKEAINLFTKAIEINHDYDIAYYNRGLTYGKELNDYDKAISDYNIAIGLNPNFIDAYYNRGLIFTFILNDYSNAGIDLNKVKELNPTGQSYLDYHKNIPKKYKYSYEEQEIESNQLESDDTELNSLSEEIEINSNNADLFYNRAVLYFSNGDYMNAISDYNRTIKLNPTDAEAYVNRGNCYSELKEYIKAISDFTKACEIVPNLVEAYVNRGNTYYELKDYDNSIFDFNKAIKINPDTKRAYYGLGNIYCELKEYSKSISCYSFAIKIDPYYAKTYYNRGLTYFKMGDVISAKEDMYKASSLGLLEAKDLLW